jgi:hypothetical protein
MENRVIRRISGSNNKSDEETGERRKLHSEELHHLYSSPNIIRQIKSRRMRWAGHVAHMGKDRRVYSVLVGKPEGYTTRKTKAYWDQNGSWGDWLGVWSAFNWLRIVAGGSVLLMR